MTMDYSSSYTLESKTLPGVHVRLRRMSFGRRLELARALRQALEQMDQVLAAGESEIAAAERATVAAEADAACLRWAVAEVQGLEIDGQPATVESLLASGPEELVCEVLSAVRAELGLNEEERKNSGSPSISCAAGRQGLASDGSATHAGASASIAAATAAAVSPSCSIPAPPRLSGCGEEIPAASSTGSA
jgi:hypothetical protein